MLLTDAKPYIGSSFEPIDERPTDVEEKRQSPPLPAWCLPSLARAAGTLPLSQMPFEALRRPTELRRQFSASVRELSQIARHHDEFVESVFAAGVSNSHYAADVAKELAALVQAAAPRRDDRHLKAVIERMADCQTISLSECGATLDAELKREFERLIAILGFMERVSLIGGWRRLGTDVAEFSYSLLRVDEESLGMTTAIDRSTVVTPGLLWRTTRTREMVTKTESLLQRIHQSIVVHRVNCPRVERLANARIHIPARVARVSGRLPSWFKDSTTVLSGPDYERVVMGERQIHRREITNVQTREHRHVEREVDAETVVRVVVVLGAAAVIASAVILAVASSPVLAAATAVPILAKDPALILGGKYVIAGWEPHEI